MFKIFKTLEFSFNKPGMKIIVTSAVLFGAVYAVMIAGCGGGGGGTVPATNSYVSKSIEISGTIDGSAVSVPVSGAKLAAPINFASECELKAFDVSGTPIYGATGYFMGNSFELSVPLNEEYGRYLMIVARLKTGHEIYKRILGRIPRYDDAPASTISVSSLRLNEETTAKTLVLLEDRTKMPATEIYGSSVKTQFEIDAEAVINDPDSTKVIAPLKTAIATIIKVMKVDNPSVNAAKTTYLAGVSALLNSFVTVAKARESDSNIAGALAETPLIVLNGQSISSSSSASDISSVVSGIQNTVKPLEVESPVFTPASGVFERPQSVTISCATPGAVIKYALYGNTPTEAYGMIYSGPIEVKESMSIKAIAVKIGLKTSAAAEAAYTLLNTSISPLSLESISIGNQNGPVDFIYKSGQTAVKSFEIDRPYFEVGFKRADGIDFTLNQTQFLRLKITLVRTSGGSSNSYKYVYGMAPGSGELDFSEDFSAPVISGRHIKFNYKTNAQRPAVDASYDLRLDEVQNVSYTNSGGLLYNYTLPLSIAGGYKIYTAAQTTVAGPVFSPAAGNYDGEIYVSMSCATAGASIRYTLDSSTPTPASGTIFNNIPILVSSSTVVKAVAFKDGMQPSAVLEAAYIINKAAAPLFDPPPGVYAGPRQITLTTKTPGASIYFTDDASANPSRSSALYSGPFTIYSSKVIKAVAVKDGMQDSNIVSAEYIINRAEPPQFNPPAGTYAGAQNIVLFSGTPGALIRYTLDGSVPNQSSALYGGPISLANYGTAEIKAAASKTDMADSAVVSAVYVILEKAARPQFSPAAGVYDAARDVAITSATPAAVIYYTLDGSAPNRSSAIYSAPVRIAASLKLSAIAVKSGMADSDAESGAYTINIPAVAKPIIYPSSGTYGSVQSAVISCATSGASIRYTLDETVPTSSSTLYSGTIEVSQTTYIKAIAFKAGMLDSQPAESYIVLDMPRPKVANPQFNPAGGIYVGAQPVSITSATAGSEIYYTLDGSRPTSSKTRYTAPFTVGANSTVKAIAIKQPDLSDSDVITAEYFIRIPKPSFSVAGGTYNEEKSVSITSGVTGAVIYYTTDGSEPRAEYQYLYGGPINVLRSMTIKAMAVKAGMLYSEAAIAQYVIKVKTPEFNPPPGNYTDTQSVAITCQTPNSAIYYTLNGTAPTPSSTLYTNPLTVSVNTTIKAVAVKSGLVNSDIAAAVYVVQPRAAKPQMTPPGGVYNSARSVTINSATAGAVIKYTTDGSTPSASSATYSGAITVSATSVVKAIAIKSGMLDSLVASESYTIDAALQMAETPAFNPPGGAYNASQNVTITSATAGAAIHYTLDGSYPTTSSPAYITPVTIDASKTIKAIAVKSGMAHSAVASATYVIKAAAPVFSPAAGTYTATQNITITSATAGAVIKYTSDGSAPSQSAGTVYSAPVVVVQNTILRAIALKTGMADSDISQAAYGIRVAAPVMSLDSGTYEGDKLVTITCATAGAAIRYTTDGSAPSTTEGTLYSGAVAVSTSMTLKAIAYKSNMLDSEITAKTYTIKTAAPVFSPAPGAYAGSVTISIACATGGAVIYYTTDGSTPTTASAQYGAPFAIETSQTIKAFAQKAGLGESTVVSAAYVISVPAPTFSPAPGTYQTAQNVTISCAMSGAVIRYTTDGSTPTAASTQYSSPISVTATTTVKAIGIKAGAQNSNVATAVYTIGVPVAPPSFNPPAGAYTGVQSVAITCATAGATIYYTTNGTEPTTAGMQYSAPITVSANMTIKTMAAKAGMIDSPVASAAYTITIPPVATPTFNPAAGTYSSAQSVTISCATAGASIYYTMDGSVPTTASTLYASPVNVSASVTIKAIAAKSGMTDSAVATAAYIINAAPVEAPVFNPPGGNYSTIQNVTITSATSGAVIHYTVDNFTPTAASPTYSSPIPVAATLTLKAIASKGGVDSPVMTAEYVISGNTFTLTTTAFANGGVIPVKYTGNGSNVSPAFSWTGVPAGTKSLALVCSDDVNGTPENPQDDYIHWVIYNISPTATGLSENIAKTASVSAGILPSGTAAQGKNSAATIGYIGPNPPAGPAHTYNFGVLALDLDPTLTPGMELMMFVMSINGKMISQTIYSGTYQAP